MAGSRWDDLAAPLSHLEVAESRWDDLAAPLPHLAVGGSRWADPGDTPATPPSCPPLHPRVPPPPHGRSWRTWLPRWRDGCRCSWGRPHRSCGTRRVGGCNGSASVRWCVCVCDARWWWWWWWREVGGGMRWWVRGWRLVARARLTRRLAAAGGGHTDRALATGWGAPHGAGRGRVGPGQSLPPYRVAHQPLGAPL